MTCECVHCRRWNPKSPRFGTTPGQEAPGLTPQETPFRYRMSYHYDPDTFHPAALETVQQMGFDALISDDRFFDVLPKGISKGPSLLRLIDWLEHDANTVLVAGDTMNDLSLFETGLKGVANRPCSTSSAAKTTFIMRAATAAPALPKPLKL